MGNSGKVIFVKENNSISVYVSNLSEKMLITLFHHLGNIF